MDLPNAVEFNRIKEFLILLVHSLDEFETIITIYCWLHSFTWISSKNI